MHATTMVPSRDKVAILTTLSTNWALTVLAFASVASVSSCEHSTRAPLNTLGMTWGLMWSAVG